MTQEQIEQKAIEIMLDGYTWRDDDVIQSITGISADDIDFAYLRQELMIIDIENKTAGIHAEADARDGYVKYEIVDLANNYKIVDASFRPWSAAIWIRDDENIRFQIMPRVFSNRGDILLIEYTPYNFDDWKRDFEFMMLFDWENDITEEV